MFNLGNVAGVVKSTTPPLEQDGVTVKKYVLWAKPVDDSYQLRYWSYELQTWEPLGGGSVIDDRVLASLTKTYSINKIKTLLATKVDALHIVDNLVSMSADNSLSANQGRILKGLIDNINTLLSSDDTTLDELQEVVNFIKQNKTDLQNLTVSNIAGLTAALDKAVADAATYSDSSKLPKGTYGGTADDIIAMFNNVQIDTIDNLLSTAPDQALSANQGRVLKSFIDNLTALVASDDTTLDELQEIVNFIKQNKADLQSLSISNIAGLAAALTQAVTDAADYSDSTKLPKATYTGTADDLLGLINAKVQNEIINNLLSTDAGKVLSAAQGKVLKDLIDNKPTLGLIDSLTSTDATKALSAAQGKILKGFIDNITTLLSSDDTTLDELQEVVTFIKQNKTDLQNLAIANIAGLVDALNGKVSLTGDESIAGVKRFLSAPKLDVPPDIKIGPVTNKTGYFSIGATSADVISFKNGIITRGFTLETDLLTAIRNFKLPNKSGTLALIEDIATLAPRTKPSKLVTETVQYIAELEDKNKFLIFQYPINFVIPSGVFANEDEIEARNKSAGDVTVVGGNGMTIQVVSSQTKKVPQYGFFGLRFESGSVGGLLGQLKPIL